LLNLCLGSCGPCADRPAERFHRMARLARPVARRGAGRLCGTSCLDGNARRFRGFRMNRHSSYWVFLVHRLSGIALALFLPVRFFVPFPPGGATDISARLLGEKLTQIWGQTVVIENRGGAGGGVGAAEAARAAPDGYTLFFPSGSVVTANQHIYAKLNYDPEKDFVPVTNVVSGPQVLVVPAGSPYKSVRALVDAAK